MKLVCISGKRRGGKTTLANILLRDYGWKPLMLAGPLKRKAMEDFDLSYEQVEGSLKEVIDERYGMTPREIMIHLGQAYRHVDKDYWVKRTREVAQGYNDRVCVIQDMRFKNELETFKKHGAFTVRLERAESLTGAYINNPSETELDEVTDWDLHVPAEANVHLGHLERTAKRIYELVSART